MRLGVIGGLRLFGFIAAISLQGSAFASDRILDLVKQRCSECHGPNGQGSNGTFPKLAGQNAEYLLRQLFNFSSGARASAVMAPQLADLTGNDLMGLADHFSAQKLIPEPMANRSLAEAGRRLYLNGNPQSGLTPCASCHGPTARGAQMLPRLAGQHAEYLELQLRRFITQSRTTDRVLMHSVASRMTEEEIRGAAYFLSVLE